MKVVITGGAGYIGTELVYALANSIKVQEVLIYDSLCKGNFSLFSGFRKISSNRVRLVQADILDSRTLKASLQGFDVLIHLAARVETPFADQNGHDFEQTNHWGTAEVAYAIEQSSVSKVIYLSSQFVYGSGEIQSEEHVKSPASFYALSKSRGEEHLIRLMDKLDVLLIRCASVYGYSKNLRFETMLNQLVFDAHFKNKIAIHGYPKSTSTFMSLPELVRIITRVLDGNWLSGIYNLSNINLSLADIELALRGLYPSLDAIYIDQHIPGRDLVMSCSTVFDQFKFSDNSLEKNLKEFQSNFTF